MEENKTKIRGYLSYGMNKGCLSNIKLNKIDGSVWIDQYRHELFSNDTFKSFFPRGIFVCDKRRTNVDVKEQKQQLNSNNSNDKNIDVDNDDDDGDGDDDNNNNTNKYNNNNRIEKIINITITIEPDKLLTKN